MCLLLPLPSFLSLWPRSGYGSTLRFADRVKQVKNQARINHDPAQARLRELLAERNSLLAECEALRAANSDLHAKVREGRKSGQAACLSPLKPARPSR